MKTELQTLIDLQEIDLKIADVRGRTAAVPDQIKSLESELEKASELMRRTLELADDQDKQRRRMEQEVEQRGEKLAKYKSQLMEVKTNKEYQAVLHEIEVTQKQIAAREDEILELMLADEERSERIRRVKEEMKQKEVESAQRRQELEEFASNARVEIERLEKERQHLQAAISPELNQLYIRIASARNGVALAEARKASCDVCHVRLRPQLFNEIKSNQSIITCESCNRILYYAGA
ncbi:MAG: zinc ribbon domain-containing protein [Acidobacteriota bacterium]